MLTELVLICSAAVAADPRDCMRSNANTVVRVPAEFGNPATCFRHARAYLAGSSIGRDLEAAERVRVVCVPRKSVVASTPASEREVSLIHRRAAIIAPRYHLKVRPRTCEPVHGFLGAIGLYFEDDCRGDQG